MLLHLDSAVCLIPASDSLLRYGVASNSRGFTVYRAAERQFSDISYGGHGRIEGAHPGHFFVSGGGGINYEDTVYNKDTLKFCRNLQALGEWGGIQFCSTIEYALLSIRKRSAAFLLRSWRSCQPRHSAGYCDLWSGEVFVLTNFKSSIEFTTMFFIEKL